MQLELGLYLIQDRNISVSNIRQNNLLSTFLYASNLKYDITIEKQIDIRNISKLDAK